MIKKFFSNIWTITIVGGLAVLLLYDLINGESFKSAIKSIPSKILFILQYPVSLWVILSALIIWQLCKWLYKKNKNASSKEESTSPKLITFRFRSFTWIWEWYLSRTGWDITNLRLICPECSKLMMFYPEAGYQNHWAKCPYCQHQIGTANGFVDNNLPNYHEVRIAIEDKIRETEVAD